MTLRDRYRDLIDQRTSSLPTEPEAFDRLTAGKARWRKPPFAIAVTGLLLASAAAVILAIRTPEPVPTKTGPETAWRASFSLYVASSDRPGEALEIEITAEKEQHR